MCCASTLLGTNLKDVSYSIKQNGIMVNLDYTDPIDDDAIIGWKSDRGWVYLTLLGVRAPKDNRSQENFSGVVKKIVIDDFDESTQLAILIRKPILGYDIINSKTSPSTIVFIHTEMRKSEVATLKQHIKEGGSSVFNVAQSSGFPKYNTNFKNAFDEAREELGPNAIFEYHGKLYTTNHPGEKGGSATSVLMKNSNSTIKEVQDYSHQSTELTEKSSPNNILEEIYVNNMTGETVTEKIGESIVLNDNEINIDETKMEMVPNEDDRWFSGVLPTYDKMNDKSPILNERIKNTDTLTIKEKPIMVESSSKKQSARKWAGIFNIFKKRKNKKKHPGENLAEKNIIDINNMDEQDLVSEGNKFSNLQRKHVPSRNQNMNMQSVDDDIFAESETQLSDTNIVATVDFDQISESINSDYQELQRIYVPDHLNVINDTLSSQLYYTSPTQSPDTNTVQAWFIDESIIPDEYDATQLQKQHIPLKRDNIVFKQEDFYPHERLLQNTQSPDTNIVQAWFIDESIIPDEYDATQLQKQHIPLKRDNTVINTNEDTYLNESPPQIPEYTDQIILERRLKTTFKNRGVVRMSRPDQETPFKADSIENNTWLSYFPLQDDSVKESLKWNFKQEREVPRYLQSERESLDYYNQRNNEYQWREQLSDSRPKSFPKRQTDPGFMYYHNGGVRVESNMEGVPIYIDGKYVGETPLARPIQVEPGWHQVSGFSPVYTYLASKSGLQSVGYNDSIIQNNESYGATTFYAEAGKLETVELKFNKMGDTPKKWAELKGGLNIGLPMFVFVMSMILYSM